MVDGTTPKIVTLDALRGLADESTIVVHEGLGGFRIRRISIKEFLDIQETAKTADGEVDEWQATLALIQSAVVEPVLGDDDVAGFSLRLTRWLVNEISQFAGTDVSFTEGSPTE